MTSLTLGLQAIRLLSGIQQRTVDVAALLKIGLRHTYRVLEDLRDLGLEIQREQRGREAWLWIRPADARRWLATLSDPGAALPKPTTRRARQ